MSRSFEDSRPFWLTLIFFTILVNLTMMRSVYLRLLEINADLTRSTWSGMILLSLLITLGCAWLVIQIQNNRSSFIGRIEALGSSSLTSRVIGALLFLVILFAISYIKFTYQIGQNVKQPVYDPGLLLAFYYWACWWLILLAAFSLRFALQTTWMGGFAVALVLLGVAFEIFLRFGAVTDYPLSLGWSEGSRYYYASLFLSEQIYGETFPLSTLHPTRYLLQSFPFLFPSLGIWWHRFWQFLLWIGLTAGASLAITSRIFQDKERAIRWLTAGWLFLFLLRVGVYYHLEVMVILPLLFLDAKKKWQSLIVIVIASIWAGVSRVNWFPMPAMIAIAIYLLEEPFAFTGQLSFKQLVNYFALPALWGTVGIASALFSQWLYVYLSGNAQNAEAFTSSFTSDLLWYRLWPNDNFSLGVLPAILIASGPLLITIITAMRNRGMLHSLRWISLIVMLLALFAGSAVVSTKIGGGGDLHNMDAYAVMVAIIGVYFFSGRFHAEPGIDVPPFRQAPVFMVALVLPLLVLIPSLGPYPQYNENRNENARQELIQVVNEISKNGPVLFINDRQLVSLGDVKVPLVYDYEVVTLMEMAMSGNRPYLDQFHADVASHRFAAIISGRQFLVIKEEGSFAEENNVWNTEVSPYILCYYESSRTIEADASRVEVYVPRLEPDSNCANGILK